MENGCQLSELRVSSRRTSALLGPPPPLPPPPPPPPPAALCSISAISFKLAMLRIMDTIVPLSFI